MKRIGVLISLYSLVSSIYAFGWNDIWLTKDQQAQTMMNQGQFTSAKDTFERHDWQAAAAYRAGDYERAAHLYQSLNSEEGFYNQGNALAHMGQYEQAIKAYDRVLTINPNHQDALYNRKLLQDLLKKDKQQQDHSNQDKQNQDKQNQDKQNQDKQNQDKQNQDKQNQDKQNQDKQNQDKQNQDKQNQDKQNQDKQNQDKQNQDKQNQDKQNQDKQNQDKQEPQNNQLNAQNKQEQQQAKEQWLRLIPDDPGGLMREKFLRDHLRRQHGWQE
ncbi:tetratricopeptide repeat protein [Legionella oakridgensis ATCC 33761 = DSM 21215]|uniref:Tetratricopeptide repeat protein n=1 Tax=Legionella oakridgensis ATCC 33761 = DSM 21215 TaxID=1268635 RepID=W0BIT9_9GAMM|nr:tetratricopeptide repeat protein [Legionella oakridgensis]AHE68324.1 tetratricopeptide repeat protein [Legionella oakridgensis ATCC 33761 = DSM 21215]